MIDTSTSLRGARPTFRFRSDANEPPDSPGDRVQLGLPTLDLMPDPGGLATPRELVKEISSHGYRIEPNQGGLAAYRQGDEKELGELLLGTKPPPSRSMVPARLDISSWDELNELAAIATGDTAALRDPDLGKLLVDLEGAGARLYTAGSGDGPSPPQLAGAYGAYRAGSMESVFVVPPGADGATRLDSPESARFFILDQGKAPCPLAEQLKQLEKRGLGFRQGQETVGSLGAYHRLRQGEPVELAIGRVPVANLDFRLEVPPETFRALAYSQAHPEAGPGVVQALALPTGLPQEDVLALYEQVNGVVKNSSASALVLRQLNHGKTSEQSLGGLVGQFLDLTERGMFPRWAADASPHLLEHPEDGAALMALAKPGGMFSDSLGSYRYLQAHRRPELGLEEDARELGTLVSRLGHVQAREVRSQLQLGEVELFLREHALSGDVESALRCLAPGGHPDLPEPLEVREQAARLVDGVKKKLLPGQSNYKFLLGLPDRSLAEDSRLLAGLLPAAGEKEARAFVADFRAGKLGRLSGPEVEARFEVELGLRGSSRPAMDAVRAGIPDHELRRQRLGQLRERFGETVHEHWFALETPLPRGVSWEEGLAAMGKLSDSLPDEREARTAYVQLVDSLREGAWRDGGLEEGVQAFLRTATVGGLERALKSLEIPRSEPGSQAGVRLESGQVIVGGVRLRARP